MVKIRDVYAFLDELAPFSSQESWDNSGLLVDVCEQTSRVLLALDITKNVVTEAMEKGAGLIISHHPVLFEPIRRLSSTDAVYQLACAGVSAICAHTNLDLAPEGVGDALARALGFEKTVGLEQLPGGWLGRVGELDTPMSSELFAQMVKDKLYCQAVRCYLAERPVKRVATASGSGASCLQAAVQAGADALVTGDVKHSAFIEAEWLDITLIDAGHFETEDVVMPDLQRRLAARFAGTEFFLSEHDHSPALVF